MRWRCWAIAVCLVMAGCAAADFEELSSLAEKPALPYSVLITGGGFVEDPGTAPPAAELTRTYALTGPGAVAFALRRLRAILARGRVFVGIAEDHDATLQVRRAIAALGQDVAAQAPELQAAMARARRAGHDFLLVVERVIDGPIEYRGVNDRWPFTLGAWLFALGSFIPDLTYESRARLQLSLRDVYSGQRVAAPILVEPGPVNLDMFGRCGFWGFVQSIVVPPFWTSTDAATITASVRATSTERMLLSAVRRLKSAEVKATLDRSGPAAIAIERVGSGWQVRVDAAEPLSAVVVRADGRVLPSAGFSQALLASKRAQDPRYLYMAPCVVPPHAERLQVLVQTDAARISSATQLLRRR